MEPSRQQKRAAAREHDAYWTKMRQELKQHERKMKKAKKERAKKLAAQTAPEKTHPVAVI